MLKIIVSITVLSFAVAFTGSSVFAHTGQWISDGSGGEIVDGSGKCIKSDNGVDIKSCDSPKPKQAVSPEPATPLAPKPQPVAVQEKVERSISLAGGALFASNSAELTGEGKTSIDLVATDLGDLTDYTISLYGHADSRGNDAYNTQISEKRAQAVADYLISKGVPASSISVYGRGETQPIASNATAKGRAKNRRVDVSVSGVKTTYKIISD